MNPVEEKILELMKKGDVKAMALLYDHYGDTLYGVILRVVGDEKMAEDVIQEAFVKIWQNSASYDPQKGRLFTWLLRICRNQAIDELRKKGRRPEIQSTNGNVYLLNKESENQNSGHDHDVNVVLGELDVHHRELVEHLYILGYSHPEISEKFGIPLGTVKTRIRKALISLRKIFGNGRS